MKKYKRYSAGFKEQALVKVYSLVNDQTIQSVADELNIHLTTLKLTVRPFCCLLPLIAPPALDKLQ